MSDDITRAERRDEYEKILSIIEHNTGGKQPALARAASVQQVAIAAGVTAPRSRLQAAVEQGDVLRIRDRVVRMEREDLQDALGELNEQVQTVADALEEVSGDGE